MTSLLAMLFLVLMAGLAIGFYALTASSIQVARSEVQVSDAAAAAESGLAFMRYELARVRVPPGTGRADLLAALHAQLAGNMQDTPNLGSNTVGFDGSTVTIPAAPGQYLFVAPDGARFRAALTQSGDRVVLRVTGRHRADGVSRTLQLAFDPARRGGLLDFAIASRGQITTDGSSRIYGSPDKTTARVLSADVVSATPIVAGGKEIGGDLSIVSETAAVDVQGSSVGGSTDPDDIQANHVHKGVPAPEFPTVEIAPFVAFATLPYTDPGCRTQGSGSGGGQPGAGPAPALARGGGGRWTGELARAFAVARGAARPPAAPASAEAPWGAGPWSPLVFGALAGPATPPLSYPRGRWWGRSAPHPGAARPGFIVLAKNDNGNGNGNGNGGGSSSGGSASGGAGGGGTTYTNCYVPAGADPTFNATDVIEGVLYVRAPNNVKFAGGCTIRGVIVVENKADLSPADTVLDFRGNVDAYGVETLSPSRFPELSAMTGSFILAENATLDFKGNFTSVLPGSIVGGAISFGGSAGGSINGSIIGMSAACPMRLSNANSSPIVFVGTGRSNPPTGLGFSTYFQADATSYLELDR